MVRDQDIKLRMYRQNGTMLLMFLLTIKLFAYICIYAYTYMHALHIHICIYIRVEAINTISPKDMAMRPITAVN